MLKDEQIEKLMDPIVSIYQQIEMELMINVAHRFSTYSSIDGSLEWYLEKLKDMNALNAAAVKIFAKYSSKSEKAIRKMLEESKFANLIKSDIDAAYDKGLSEVTYEELISNKIFKDTLERSYRELSKSLKLIQTKALESQSQAYLDILNKAYIGTSSGVYSYQQTIWQGIQDMAKHGITGATYRRKDGKIIHHSIEAVVRRDVITAVHRLANEVSLESIDVLGTNYIDISSHLGARVSDTNPIADHAGWQGKQYQIKGESKDYPNFEKSTGYGDILGFGGVNCRHRGFPFFPGFSEPYANTPEMQENKEHYQNVKKQRTMERKIRQLKKRKNCLKAAGDKDSVKKLNEQINQLSHEIDTFCEENNLKRDHSRERVT